MANKESTKVLDAKANAVRTLLNANTAGANTGMIIKLYQSGGTPPATAKAPVVGTLLLTLSNNGTNVGLTLDEAVEGILQKPNAEVWKGVVAANGTPDYFRMTERADDPTVNDTTGLYARCQGTVGLFGADLNIGPLPLVSGEERTMDNDFFYAVPTY